WRKNKQVGEQALLVVRPEKIHLSLTPSGADNEMQGKIVHRIYLGTNTTYLVELQDEEVVTAFVQNRGDKAEFEQGEKVYLSWAAENCFLLDEVSQDGC
ncbi:MAG: TOBE domain-containing protein, partial [Anaerolineales bacterium]|nr:TOBE domain-containing protein [Anaerolineales bacterium]